MKIAQMIIQQKTSAKKASLWKRGRLLGWIALTVLLLPILFHLADLAVAQRRVGQLRDVLRQAELAPVTTVTGPNAARTNQQRILTLSLLSTLSNAQMRRLLYIPWSRVSKINAHGLRYEELTLEQQQWARAVIAVGLQRPFDSIRSEDIDLAFVVYPSERGWLYRYDYRLCSDPQTAVIDVGYILEEVRRE